MDSLIKDNYWNSDIIYRKCWKCSHYLKIKLSKDKNKSKNITENIIKELITRAHIQNNFDLYSSYFFEIGIIIEIEILNNKKCNNKN